MWCSEWSALSNFLWLAFSNRGLDARCGAPDGLLRVVYPGWSALGVCFGWSTLGGLIYADWSKSSYFHLDAQWSALKDFLGGLLAIGEL